MCEFLTHRKLFIPGNIHTGAYYADHVSSKVTAVTVEHVVDLQGSIDENKVVAVAFVDFKKAFDCVSHPILLHKLRSQFGIQGTLLSWLTDYLTDRTQFSVVNGQHSSVLNVTCGIPQGSVLGPTLFALYTNDLPSAVTSGSVFMYADDTTVYCIGDTVDNAVTSLNKALSELNSWCLENSLTPHSAK